MAPKRTSAVVLLVSLLLSAKHREYILGDLAELYTSRLRTHGRWWARFHYGREAFLSMFVRRRVGKLHNGMREGSRNAPWMHLGSDVRQAIRVVRRQPGFVLVVVLTLGVGVGSVGAVFGMANQLILRPPSGIIDPGNVAILEFQGDYRNTGLSGPEVEEVRRAATLLDGLATYDYMQVFAGVDGSRPVDIRAATVFGDYFEILGVRPVLGRVLTVDETGRDANPFVAVISERLWETLFDRSPDALGAMFRANGHSIQVVGVAGAGFRGTNRYWAMDMWVPRNAFAPLNRYPSERIWSPESRLNQDFVVRPGPGTSLAAAQAQLNAILQNGNSYMRDRGARLYPGLLDPLDRETLYSTLGVLGGAVLLVLLISCANVANLLVVREVQRRGEVAVRRALGASVWRTVRSRLVESLVFGMAGTVVGVAVAWVIGLTFRGETLRFFDEFEGFVFDGRVLAFGVVATSVTVLLFATLPAAIASRFDLQGGLRCAGAQSTDRFHHVRHAMSSFQIALSLALLIGSMLLGKTVSNLYALDVGVDVDGFYLTRISGITLDDSSRTSVRSQTLPGRVGNVPGVRAAALEEYGPFSTQLKNRFGRRGVADRDLDWRFFRWVSAGWFEAMGIEPLSGRTFDDRDTDIDRPLKVVITAALARRVFDRVDVVGAMVRVGQGGAVVDGEVIGVVGDMRLRDVRSEPDEAFFVPGPDTPGYATTVVVRSVDDQSVLADAREVIEGVFPDVPVPSFIPVSDRIDVQLSEQRIMARLLALVSSFAVFLAAIGLYGVISYAVTNRRREIGIRMALGAGGLRISSIVVRSAVGIVMSGAFFGVGGAMALSQVIESRLFGVEPIDPASYSASLAVFALVAIVASWVPSRAATRVDPVTALRTD